MSEPHKLHPVPKAPMGDPIKAGTLRSLAWLMREAEAGRVHAIAVVYIKTDPEDGEDSSGNFASYRDKDDLERVIGLCTLAQRRLSERWESNDLEPYADDAS